MKIHGFILTTFLLLYAVQLKAQQNDFTDKVLLKDGSVFVGKIVYYLPNDTLKMQIQNGQVTYFLPTQIQKVVMEKSSKPYNFRERGLYDAASFMINFGRSASKAHIATGFQNVLGYQFNRLVGSGIGVGYDSYYLTSGQSDVLSLFGEYRGYLTQKNISEYWTFAAGFGQPVKSKNELFTNLQGSFMIQPTLGLRFGASRRYNFFTDLGFRWQQIRFEDNNSWSENRYTVTYRRWILRGGIVF